jgi:HSP20 family protein
MALTRWDPFAEMTSLRQAIDRLLEESFVLPRRVFGRETAEVPLDLMERDDALIAKVAIPGVKPEDIEINIQNNVLTIRGEMREEQETPRGRYHWRERRTGMFMRQVTLPVEVNADAATATYEHGVLTITMPKAERVRPKQIPVRVQGQAEPVTSGTQGART